MPQIAIEYYFILVAMNSGLEPEQALTVLIVVERVCNHAFAKGQQFVINSLCAHRLVLGTVLVLTKFYNDVYFSNQAIAGVCGMSLKDLNAVEEYLLELIDYKLFITE